MGKFINGINGPFTGTVGTVIGSSRYGIPYMKGRYKKRTSSISEKEELNRRKFAASQKWLKAVTNFVRIGFKGYSAQSEGFVSAKSYLHKNVLKVEEDKIIIEPGLVRVSFGDLPMSEPATVCLTAPGELTFTWNTEATASANNKDQVMLLAYNIAGEKAYMMLNGQFRSAGSDILSFDAGLKAGTILHIYMAFVAADRCRQSDSLYLGTVTI